jgi:hypothetical protein
MEGADGGKNPPVVFFVEIFFSENVERFEERLFSTNMLPNTATSASRLWGGRPSAVGARPGAREGRGATKASNRRGYPAG